jgi:predicted MarR family transcription regulator
MYATGHIDLFIEKNIATRSETLTQSVTSPLPPSSADERFWHLARTSLGVALTDLEVAGMRCQESFLRWQTECLHAVTGVSLSGVESTLLHAIGMHERPKNIRELMQYTNRQDVPNIQYGLRKLLKFGFIVKSGSGPKGVFYTATAEGLAVCQNFATLREKLMLRAISDNAGFERAAQTASAVLESLEHLYESVTHEAMAFHRRSLQAGREAGQEDFKVEARFLQTEPPGLDSGAEGV